VPLLHVMDRNEFLTVDFDVKAWINFACNECSSAEELVRFALASPSPSQCMHCLIQFRPVQCVKYSNSCCQHPGAYRAAMLCLVLSRLFSKKGQSNTRCACRYLPELEMKVQLAAEDVELQMHDISNLIISRTAVAAEEAGHMRAELATISDSVDDLSQRATGHERSYAADVARLQGLDSVKSRMLAAKSTLKVGACIRASCDDLLLAL
jgi:hypothetical protein